MLGLGDPDDPWFRLREALGERRREHIKQTMAGTLSPEQYAAITARFDEDDKILALIQQIRRGEDVAPPLAPRESVGDQYGA